MQHVDPQTLPQVSAPVATPILDRRAKLLRWADLIEKEPRSIILLHGLEYHNQESLDDRSHWSSGTSMGITPFALAAGDPVFQDAGLLGHAPGDAMRFFELDQGQLHSFSCNCGGAIDRREMASRIRALADTKPGGIIGAVRSFIGI